MKNTNSYQTRRGLFTLLSIVLIASACAHAEKKTEPAVPIAPAKKEIVFINGSHFDETSWFEVVRITLGVKLDVRCSSDLLLIGQYIAVD